MMPLGRFTPLLPGHIRPNRYRHRYAIGKKMPLRLSQDCQSFLFWVFGFGLERISIDLNRKRAPSLAKPGHDP
jgi:hypothetical protein